MKSTSMILPLAGLLATGLFASAAGNMQAPATAQITAKQYFACYVPATGTVYLIKQPGLRSECASGHVQFSWSDGASSPAVSPAVVVTDPDGWAATGGGAASDVVCSGCVGTSDLANGAVTAVKLAAGVARNTHWAGVTSVGSVFKQTGGITGSLTGTGTYDLTFPSGLILNTGCANIASGADGTNILQTIAGPRFGAPANVLRVRVFDVAGNPVNSGFEVAVICL